MPSISKIIWRKLNIVFPILSNVLFDTNIFEQRQCCRKPIFAVTDKMVYLLDNK